jgi:hypothetical protein
MFLMFSSNLMIRLSKFDITSGNVSFGGSVLVTDGALDEDLDVVAGPGPDVAG